MSRQPEILLVEENPKDEKRALRALNRVSNRVVVVRDGEESLDYPFARGHYAARPVEEVPAVVLLDLQRPNPPPPGIEIC